MQFQNLRYLDALAREEHFARAAAACRVTQPTLSAGIKQLEEELGLLIVQRGQRYQGLTPEGLRVLHWARRILSDWDSLEQEAGALTAGLSGRLRLGVIPVALPSVALLTEPFSARHPGVTVTVLSLSSIEIQRGLDDFSLDAGVTYLDNEPLTHARSIPLYRERYYLVTPADGPLGRRRSVTLAEAAGQPLILMTPDMQNRRIVNAMFERAGASPRAAIETNSVVTLWAHVRSGAWSTILPHPFLHLFGEPEGVRALPLEGDTANYTVGLAIPDREPLTPSARELAALAEGLDLAGRLEARKPAPRRRARA